MSATYLLAGSRLLSGIMGFQQARRDARARQRQAEYESEVMENNALLAEYNALEALHAGQKKQEHLGRVGRELVGQARVRMGASGLKGGESLIGDIYDAIGEDIHTIDVESTRQAALFDWKAESLRHNARVTRMFARPSGMEGVGSLLAGITGGYSALQEGGVF